MTLLGAGLVLFFVPHLVPMFPTLRNALASRWGELRYKGVYSVVSGVGLILIVVGYAYADRGGQWFAPIASAKALAPYAMVVVFILLASSHTPSHIRAAIKHPMLVATLIWSLVHLLANGDARGTVLFGSFAVFAAVDLVSVARRAATASFVPRLRGDVISIVAGTVVALLFMTFHRVLFGPAVVAFGV